MIKTIKEIFATTRDLARVIPVTKAKLPDNDDFESMGLILEKTAEKYPDHTMIIFEGKEITWSEFNKQTNALGRAMLERGVKQGDGVAVIMENRIEMLVSIFALQKIGAIAGLVNPSLVGSQLAHCIRLTKSVKCFAGEEIANNVMELGNQIDLAPADIFWVADQRSSECPEGMEDIFSTLHRYETSNMTNVQSVRAGDTGFYIFTSGTTGLPKAARIGHRRLYSAGYGFSKIGVLAKPGDRMYLCLPLFHGTGFVCGVGSALFSGATMFLRRKFSATHFWKDVKEYNINIFFYVGELCRYLINQPECPEEKNNSLDRIFGNGLRPDIWDEFKSRFGIDRMCEFYGSSEGNISFLNALNKNKTIGMCAGNALLVKYDIENDEIIYDTEGKFIEAEFGEPGLLLGGVDDRYQFDGYTDDDASDKKILRNVKEQGDAWFNTGDLLKQIDVGFAFKIPHYQFVDRIGDTYRWRSENVSTNEVGEILNEHSQIEISNVYGVSVPGTEGKAGMAAVTLPKDCQFDIKSFSDYVFKNLPHFARPVFLRIQEAHETTGTFKLLKGDLKKQGYNPDLMGSDKLFVLMPKTELYLELNDEKYQSIVNASAGF